MLAVFSGPERVEIVGDHDGLRELANFLLSLTDPASDRIRWPDVHYDASGVLEGTLTEARSLTTGLQVVPALDIRRAPPEWDGWGGSVERDVSLRESPAQDRKASEDAEREQGHHIESGEELPG